MLIIEKKKHGIHFITAWYAKQKIKTRGIVQYKEAEFPNGIKTHTFQTLVTDLTKTEEEITGSFSKNCRNLVNRAVRENVTSKMIAAQELNETDVAKFMTFFMEFWGTKEREYSEEEQRRLNEELLMYKGKNALTISCAILEEKTVVYHTYITDGVHARLWHSASLYRTDDSKMANLVGMANRYLHKQDMFYFKENGYVIYDWGGAGTSDEVLHITEFKKSFGGEPKNYYHFEEIKGVWPKTFRVLTKLLKS